MRPVQKIPGAKGAGDLSIALIGPEERRRKAVADALAEYQTSQKRDPKGLGREVRPSGTSLPAGDGRQALTVGIQIWEFPAYPDGIDDLPRMLQQQFDVVIVDLDSNPEYALEIVESICSSSNAAVMVYSEQADLHLAVRFMRAGAREFLTLPLAHDDIAGALARVSIRQPASRLDQKATGSLFVFLGAKGGCGVTTIASNFALALAQESGQNTLLIDFGLPLGDAAINLGMATEYSTANALQDFSRLDANFLSGLLAKHSSGLNVLAAPSEFNQIQTSKEAVDKLLGVARANFDYVVVDFGSRLDLKDSDLFADSAMLYLITQVGVSAPWHFLYFFPLPQGQGSLRPTFSPVRRCVGWLHLRRPAGWPPPAPAASCGGTPSPARRWSSRAARVESRSRAARFQRPSGRPGGAGHRRSRRNRPRGCGAASTGCPSGPRICIRKRNRTVSSWNFSIMASNMSKDSRLYSTSGSAAHSRAD
jgi:pilus assembly protein CpaE